MSLVFYGFFSLLQNVVQSKMQFYFLFGALFMIVVIEMRQWNLYNI